MPFLLIFILVPLLELVVLFKVGAQIGILWTLLLILATAVVGVTLLRQQGMEVLMRAGQKMHEGSLPAKELAEGFMLAVAGAMLLTPGFLTDALGFSLLVPAVRAALVGSVVNLIRPKMQSGGFGPGSGSTYGHEPQQPSHSGRSSRPDANSSSQGTGQARPSSHKPDVIEGEFRRED